MISLLSLLDILSLSNRLKTRFSKSVSISVTYWKDLRNSKSYKAESTISFSSRFQEESLWLFEALLLDLNLLMTLTIWASASSFSCSFYSLSVFNRSSISLSETTCLPNLLPFKSKVLSISFLNTFGPPDKTLSKCMLGLLLFCISIT